MAIMVGGSRLLSDTGVKIVNTIASNIINNSIVVGCAAGADQCFIDYFESHGALDRLIIKAVGGRLGYGFPSSWATSTAEKLRRLEERGAAVEWWAGGLQDIPMTQRLAIRSKFCVNAGDECLFVVGSPQSKGSINSATYAAKQKKPVTIWCDGFDIMELPFLLPFGGWHRKELYGLECVEWVYTK